MRAVIQRVSESCVIVDNTKIREIGLGLVIFLGIFDTDKLQDVKYLTQKIAVLRIFNDNNNNMNLSIQDVNASALIVSQFTLCADTNRGRRPSFIRAANPQMAEGLYDEFCNKIKKMGIPIKKGKFGATMQVQIKNEGPITIILDSNLPKL